MPRLSAQPASCLHCEPSQLYAYKYRLTCKYNPNGLTKEREQRELQRIVPFLEENGLRISDVHFEFGKTKKLHFHAIAESKLPLTFKDYTKKNYWVSFKEYSPNKLWESYIRKEQAGVLPNIAETARSGNMFI